VAALCVYTGRPRLSIRYDATGMTFVASGPF
jgi:hypothetical protein